MVSALAQKTIKRITAGLQTGESAALSEIVELIQQLSDNAQDTSVQELASLIGKDLVVTSKVIIAANTMGFNPTGLEVSTLTHAIQLIGFNKIRQLAISLLLVETAERTLNPEEKREIATLALCSGFMAESVMTQHGSHSPEQAFICASLRNYGRLLMTTFMLEDYREARRMSTTGLPEDEAFSRVFGLTPLDLGYHLLASANLPKVILKSLQEPPPDAVRKAGQIPDVELLLLSDMCVKMCGIAIRPELSTAEFQVQIEVIADQAGRAFDMDSDDLLTALGEAGERLRDFASTFGLTSLTGAVGKRISSRVNRVEPAPAVEAKPVDEEVALVDLTKFAPPKPPLEAPPETSPANAPSSDQPDSETVHAGIPEPQSEEPPPETSVEDPAFRLALEEGIQQLAGFLDEDPINMLKVYKAVLKASIQGLVSSETLLFVQDRSRPFGAAYGIGKLFESIRDKPLVNSADRNVFGVCLHRLEDILIYDAHDPKIQPHLPDWIKSSTLGSFVILPLHESKRPFALLLVGWGEKRSSVFTGSQIKQVRSLLKLAGTAKRLSSGR